MIVNLSKHSSTSQKYQQLLTNHLQNKGTYTSLHGAALQMCFFKVRFYVSRYLTHNIHAKISDLCEVIISLIYYKLV